MPLSTIIIVYLFIGFVGLGCVIGAHGLGGIIDEIGALRAPIVFIVWLLSLGLFSVMIGTEDSLWNPWLFGISWSIEVAIILMLIPGLNYVKIAGPIFMIILMIEAGKIFWGRV